MRRSAPRPGRAVALVLALAAAGAPPPAAAAVVVESAQAPPGVLSPLAPGDELSGWRQPGTTPVRTAEFSHWGDLDLLAFLESPRGTLEIDLVRGGEPRRVTLLPAAWTFRGRPPEAADDLPDLVASFAAGTPPTAADLERRLAGRSDTVRSWVWKRFGEAADHRSDWRAAEAAYATALPLVPPAVAADLERLRGEALHRLDRLDEAEAGFRRAQALWESLEPDGLGVSLVLSALANRQAARYELADAQRLFQTAVRIRARLAPGSWLHASALGGLGQVAGRRNDLAAAERHFEAALALAERGKGDLAPLLANLGVVCRLRGDFERAKAYTRRGLELRRAAGNRRLTVASLINLANLEGDAGNLDAAIGVYTEAAGLLDGGAPDRLHLALLHANRAKLHWLRRDAAAAAADVAIARELLGFQEPGTDAELLVTSLESELAQARGDLAAAVRLAEQTLAGRIRLQPDSSLEAQAASQLARLRVEQGLPEAAEELFEQSVRALERQQGRLGGGERGLIAFRDKYAAIYRAYQEFLREQGRTAAAFEVYERSRAAALLALLNQRDLDLPERDLPAGVGARRRALAVEIEQAYVALVRLAPEAAAERESARRHIESLHAERERLDRQALADSPRLAAIEAPPVLELDEIRRALAPGTLLLAYSVGEDRSTLFALPADGALESHHLPVGERTLADDVERWVALTTETALRRGELAALERRLADRLLRPVAGRIATARRLVIVPDGPLHGLSFAALPQPERPARRLIEALPVARQVSASVHAQLARQRPRPIDTLAVFADPPSVQYGDDAAARLRAGLGPLPAARREASRLRALFGERAHLYLGAAATETAARRELETAPLVHFATHAVIDPALPLDSALLLAPGPDDEGLLQAWEVAEQLEVASDLVVLSGCDTARGAERGGEGILGLVRALQVAGARSVIASLWRVDDESAAELMSRFYAGLRTGLARDEALRQAQLTLLGGPVTSERDGQSVALRLDAPRHWAPFVLIGPAD
jgi:CHAT domain-containing protein/tetratricopeptide (TPR) repeat protein